MATIVIDNLDAETVEQFKAFALQQGVSLSVFSGTTVTKIVQPTSTISLHDALLKIPKSDDDTDIFLRDYPQTAPNRDIDWAE